MSTYNLRRFSRPEGLAAIRGDHLIDLLNPYSAYLHARGVPLPATGSFESADLDRLAGVFMSPDADTPKALADALYFIHEMATPDGMDLLLEEHESGRLVLDEAGEPTPADIAVQAYLRNPQLLERKHAELYAREYRYRPRSFQHFQARHDIDAVWKSPSERKLRVLEKSLDDWFEQKRRGRGTRVFVFAESGIVWLLVRHGDPFKREGSLEEGEPGSVLYRPARYDVLAFDRQQTELRIHAGSANEIALYREQLGKHLFGDSDFFPAGANKYTLEPLRTDRELSLVCNDVEGIESVRLTEVGFAWGGAGNEIEIRRADDVFACYRGRGRTFPARARIVRARFSVKFTDRRTPRSAVVRPPNVAQYTQDRDSEPLEAWLQRRGFILPKNADE